MGVDPAVEEAAHGLDRALQPASFDELWERHATRAMQLAGLLTGNVTQAEDAVAEAFARVFPRWQRGKVEAFWPYLRTALVNQVRGTARRSRTAALWRLGQAPTVDAPSAEQDIAERAELAVALRQLAPLQRRALVLRFFEDLSEADTAQLLGCSVGTVKSSTSRGLAQLRALLQEGGSHAG
jgi:RNA polymerase sigma-70 factor (sigma-E family)